MNMKPDTKMIEKWWKQASDEFAFTSDGEIRKRFSELAAQWGSEQAQLPPVEEPESPEPVLYRCEDCRKTGLMIHCSDPINCGGMVSYYTATQMHDHFAAGVRSGMGQSQWQPIETAPKDGRSFDVWVKSTKNPDYGVRMTGVYYVQGVLCGSKFPNSSWCEYASHWMPLPTPPAMQGGQK